MTSILPADRQPPPPTPEWSDDRVDRALVQFFSVEVPARLPTPVARPLAAVRAARGRLAAAAGLATVAAAGWLLLIAPPAGVPIELVETRKVAPREVVVSFTEPGPREVFEASSGWMEQQTALKVTTVSWLAPDQGDVVEWQVPEFSMDFVPLASSSPGEFR